ncbi:MAG: 30S ribosomal protein S20 [Candidatus Omnitrophota bacterium]
MPQRQAAIKRLRVDKKRHQRNLQIKSGLKKSIKKFQELLTNQKLEEAKTAIRALISKIDKVTSKGILKKNTASRKKSQLMKRLAVLSKKPSGKV